jgi:hypothetical protein
LQALEKSAGTKPGVAAAVAAAAAAGDSATPMDVDMPTGPASSAASESEGELAKARSEVVVAQADKVTVLLENVLPDRWAGLFIVFSFWGLEK